MASDAEKARKEAEYYEQKFIKHALFLDTNEGWPNGLYKGGHHKSLDKGSLGRFWSDKALDARKRQGEAMRKHLATKPK